jgi:hypothetical protein
MTEPDGAMVAPAPEAEGVPVTGAALEFASPEAPAGLGDPSAKLPRFVQPAALAASRLFANSLQRRMKSVSDGTIPLPFSMNELT